MQPTASDRALIKSEEGVVSFVYDDAIAPARRYIRGTRIKGNLTGGAGHLLSRGSDIFPEAEAWIGKTIPPAVIDQWLTDDLASAWDCVNASIKVPLQPQQRGALLSLAFNIGNGAFAKSSVVRDINVGNMDRVPADFAKFNKTRINGVLVTSKGLTKRRALEVAYWLGGKAPAVVDAAKAPPASTEIGEAAPKGWGPTEILGAGGTVSSLAAAGFSSTGVLAYTFAGLLVVAVLVIGAIALKRYVFRG